MIGVIYDMFPHQDGGKNKLFIALIEHKDLSK